MSALIQVRKNTQRTANSSLLVRFDNQKSAPNRNNAKNLNPLLKINF